MADYIDREELRKLFKQRIFGWSSKDSKLLMGKNGKWVDALSELPSVDAVEVVRCKDCKKRNSLKYCERHDFFISDDYYCASGVKKNEINTRQNLLQKGLV